MTASAPYTLENLRGAAEAAWLWDGVRGRIVWANKPAIHQFGGKSMFDLIDRPFDLNEPGIERIADLARNLPRGETIEALLHFPSTGQTVPIHALCMIHALIDGRAGVLVVEKSAEVAVSDPTQDDDLNAAFDLMPMAAGLIDRDGRFTRLNGEAQRLLAKERSVDLASLMGNEPAATELRARLLVAATASAVQVIETPFGQRDIRLTLQRLSGAISGASLLLMDDITERRALEQRMEDLLDHQEAPTKGDDGQAFETIGAQLTSALIDAPKAVEVDIPKLDPITPPKPLRNVPEIPAPLRDALNRVSDALLITQNNQIIFANNKTLELLSFKSSAELVNNDDVWSLFSSLGQSLPSVAICHDVVATITMSTVAWHGGPARQFLLKGLRPTIETPVAPILKVFAAPETELKIMASSEPEIEVEPAATTPVLVSETPTSNVVKLQPTAKVSILGDEDLRSILDIASDGIITLDRLGRIQSLSAGAEALFGYRTAEVADQQLADLLTVESRKTLKEYLAFIQGPGVARVLNDGREITAVVKQGGSVALFLTIGALPSKKSTASFYAVLRDITQWKRTEKELRDTVEIAQASSRQKSDFLAHISHELRTPLNSIIGFSEMMRLERFGAIENEKYRGYVNDIHTSGNHLLSLINDLLDLSKVEAGKLDLNFTSVSVSDVVDQATRMLQEAATVARVVVRKAIPAKLPNVVADLRSLRQVLLNLLSNAIKFTDPGGQVIISATLNDDGALSLRVKDTGIGMNVTEIRDALEPFKRIEAEGRVTSGTGLGLPLTKALVEANRAGFVISSEPRKGTMIEITFPTTRVLAE